MTMTKLRLDVELHLDFPINQQDEEELAWFRDEVLGADPAGLFSLRLFSNEIGDTLGAVRVVSWWMADRLPETYEWTVPGGASGVVTGFGDTDDGLVDFFVSHPRLDNIDICQEFAAELLRLARRKGVAHVYAGERQARLLADELATLRSEHIRLRQFYEHTETVASYRQAQIDSLLENSKLGAQAGLTVDQLIERVREWVIGNCGLDSFEGQAETADFEEGLRWVFENEFGDYLLPRDTAPAEFDPAGFLTLLHRHVYPERDESFFEVPSHSTHYALRHLVDGPAIDFWYRQTADDKAAIAADSCATVLRDVLALLEDALYEDRPGVWFVSYKEDAEVEGAAKTIGRLREVVARLPPAPPSTDSIWDWMRSNAPAWGQKPREARSAPAGGPDQAGASPEAGREGGGPQSAREAELQRFVDEMGRAGFKAASASELAELAQMVEKIGPTDDPGFGRDAGSPLTKEWPNQEGERQVWVRMPEGAKIYGAQPGDRFLGLSPDEAVVLFDILRHIGGDPVRSPRRHASSLAHKLWELVGQTDPRPNYEPLPKDPSPEGVTGPCLYYLDDLPPARIWGKEPAEPEEEPAAPLGDVEALRLKIEELEGFVYRMHRRLVHFEPENAPF